jgi:hypothetical protein
MQPMTGTAAPDPEADYGVLRWRQQVRCCPDAMQSPTDHQDLREYSSCTSAQVFPAFEIYSTMTCPYIQGCGAQM